MMLNVATILPTFINNRTNAGAADPSLAWDPEPPTEFDRGLIISIFFLAQIVFAPVNTSIKNSLGSKTTIIVGFVLMTATTFGLGMIAPIQNTN